MPHRSDPYIDEPAFRDPPMVNRYGRPVTRSSLNPGVSWTRAMVGIGAILIVFGLAYYGWSFGKVGPEFTDSARSTIGQAR